MLSTDLGRFCGWLLLFPGEPFTDHRPLQRSILDQLLQGLPTGTCWRRSAQLAQIVLETKTILLNLDLLIGYGRCQIRTRLLKRDIILVNVLVRTLTQTRPSIPAFCSRSSRP